MTDDIPYPIPTTRGQAVSNALYYAHIVEDTIVTGAPLQPGQTAFLKCQMWATIAPALPDLPDEPLTIYADDQPTLIINDLTDVQRQMMAQQRVEHIRGSDDPAGTVTVTSAAWNILRALGIQYVLSSLNKNVVIDMAQWQHPGCELRVVWVAGSPTVQVFVDPAP